jgi:hypothetical protein
MSRPELMEDKDGFSPRFESLSMSNHYERGRVSEHSDLLLKGGGGCGGPCVAWESATYAATDAEVV